MCSVHTIDPFILFCSFVTKGEVVSLEVVNKKWARVFLTAGSSSGPVSNSIQLGVDRCVANLMFRFVAENTLVQYRQRRFART